MVEQVFIWGAISSLAFSVVVFVSWKFFPKVWLADITEGKEKPEPMSLAIATVVITLLIFILGATAAAWFYAKEAETSFLERATAAWLVLVMINLFDLFFVDLFVYWWLYPRFMQIEGYPKFERIWPHFDGFIKGVTLFGLPISALAAWISG